MSKDSELKLETRIASVQADVAGSLFMLHLIDPHDTVRRGERLIREKEDDALKEEIEEEANNQPSIEAAEAYMRGAYFAYLYSDQVLRAFGKTRAVLTPKKLASVRNKQQKSDLEKRASRLVADPIELRALEDREPREIAVSFDPPLLAALQDIAFQRPVTENADFNTEARMLMGAHSVILLTEVAESTSQPQY